MDRKTVNYEGSVFDLGLNQIFSESYDAQHFTDPTAYITVDMKVLGNRQGSAIMEGGGDMSLLDSILGRRYVTAKLTVPFTFEMVQKNKSELDDLIYRIAGQMTAINMIAQEGMTAAQKANARQINIDSMAVRRAKEIIAEKGIPWDGETFTAAARTCTRDSAVAKVMAENSVSGSSRVLINSETANDMEEGSRKKVVTVTSASGETSHAIRIMSSAAGLKRVPIFNITMKRRMEAEVAKLYKYIDSHKDITEYNEELALKVIRGLPDALEIKPVYERAMREFTQSEEDQIQEKAKTIYAAYIDDTI